jgi:hypothetical protein
LREREEGLAIREGFLGSGSKFSLRLRVGFDEVLEALLSVGKIISIEDSSEVLGDFALQMLLCD